MKDERTGNPDRSPSVLGWLDYTRNPSKEWFPAQPAWGGTLTSAIRFSLAGNTSSPEQYYYNAATGNLDSMAGLVYTYGTQSAACPNGALSKPHAVVSAGTKTFCYDANGNMVQRTIGGTVYNLTYDAENRPQSMR